MRRLVVLSALLVLLGLVLLLPSVPIWNLLTTGSTSSGSTAVVRFGAPASSTDNTTTIESLAGFGAIGVGLILEVFSLFTDGLGATPAAAKPESAGESKP